MKTNATPEVVYGILLEKKLKNYRKGKPNSEEEMYILFKEIKEKGYEIEDIKETTLGLRKKDNSDDRLVDKFLLNSIEVGYYLKTIENQLKERL